MIIKLAPPELLFVSVGGIVTIMGVSRLVHDPGIYGPVRNQPGPESDRLL